MVQTNNCNENNKKTVRSRRNNDCSLCRFCLKIVIKWMSEASVDSILNRIALLFTPFIDDSIWLLGWNFKNEKWYFFNFFSLLELLFHLRRSFRHILRIHLYAATKTISISFEWLTSISTKMTHGFSFMSLFCCACYFFSRFSGFLLYFFVFIPLLLFSNSRFDLLRSLPNGNLVDIFRTVLTAI